MTSSVVRIGPLETSGGVNSAKLLRTALISYFNNNDDTKDDSIRISNKYFTAKVLLEAIISPVENSKEDGIILVFDALESNPDRSASSGNGITFDGLAQSHQKAQDNEKCGDLLRLCVGVSLTELSPEEARGKHHEQEYSRRILWCLDHGYEYIEADLSQEGQLTGHDLRDKDGFARIVEAIQGTIWSSAVMGQSKTTQLKEEYQEDKSALKEEEGEEEENPYQPPDPSKFKVEQKGSVEDMEILKENLDEEKVFDEMDTVLREASRIREQSKTGQLTDEERRERAGDAALRLVNLMHQFGMDEDEDGSIVDSSDEDSGIIATS
jgi:hypothetical protein